MTTRQQALVIGTILCVPFIALNSWASSPFSKFAGTYQVEKCTTYNWDNNTLNDPSTKVTLETVDTIVDGQVTDSYVDVRFQTEIGGEHFKLPLMNYKIPATDACLTRYQISTAHDVSSVVTGSSGTAATAVADARTEYVCTEDQPQTYTLAATLSMQEIQGKVALKYQYNPAGTINPETIDCLLVRK